MSSSLLFHIANVNEINQNKHLSWQEQLGPLLDDYGLDIQ